MQFVTRKREAQLFQSMPQRRAAGVLAQHQMRLGHAHQRGSHDLVAERVGQHTVLMNAGLVRKSVVAHDCLVGRRAKGDDLAQHLAAGIELAQIDAGGDAEAVAAHIERSGNLFQSRIAGSLADAVDGALHLACAVMNRGQ